MTKGIDTPYHIMSCSAIKLGSSFSKVAVALGLAERQSAVVSVLAPLVDFFFNFTY